VVRVGSPETSSSAGVRRGVVAETVLDNALGGLTVAVTGTAINPPVRVNRTVLTPISPEPVMVNGVPPATGPEVGDIAFTTG
jgi:hypothetical protein